MIARRTVIAAAVSTVAGAGLTGCTEAATVEVKAPVKPNPPRRSPSTTVLRRPEPKPITPAPRAIPSRAAIIAEFGGRRPREWGLHSTGTINRGTADAVGRGLVALTFDACGGSGSKGYDAKLIAHLRRLRVKATLMLNSQWIQANPSIARELGSDSLFQIQSHGHRHLPLSVSGRTAYKSRGTLSVAEVYDELTAGNAIIEQVSGKPVSFMRPGTAFSDEVSAAIARRLGTPVMDFSVNGDAGTTFRPAQIVRALSVVRPGDIVIGHMNHPEHWTAAGYAAALPRLLDRGIRFAHLTEVAGTSKRS